MVTLSLCMIVKNEEAFLEKCLQSVQGLVDEIVIVDTGSTDKTKEIARRFTVNVYDFKWCDDFAAARNESLKYATGEWILVLDADEVIAKEDFLKIRELIENNISNGYYFCQRNYTSNSECSGFIFADKYNSNNYIPINCIGWFDSWIVRLFTNNNSIIFSGQVHERVDKSIIEKGETIDISTVVVHHYGEFKGNSLISKKKFYQQLGEAKIKTEPNNSYAYFELAVVMKELGNLIGAEEMLGKAFQLNPDYFQALLELGIIKKRLGKVHESINCYEKVLLTHKDCVDAYIGLGCCYFVLSDLVKAKNYFLNAINFDINCVDAYINLGAVYEREGCFKEAIEVLLKAITILPNSYKGYYNLGVVCERLLYLPKAVVYYKKALELGCNDQELQERVEKIEKILNE